MSKVTECSIIIKDDFNNVLIAQRKVKKSEPKLWSIFSRTLRGKETPEKCINRAIKEDLKSIIFDLELIGDNIAAGGENNSLIYTGTLREKVCAHADIVECKWINKSDLDTIEFAPGEKEKILKFYNV